MATPVIPLRTQIVISTNAGSEALAARSGHRVAADENNLYVWGGYNPDYEDFDNTPATAYPLLKELWKFNFWSKKWRKLLMSGDVPVELASHTVLKIGQRLFHFGGTGVPFGHASTDALSVLDLRTLEWKHCPCEGNFPTAKYGHTMTLIDNYIYIIGGTTGFTYNMEVHRLDLCTLTWENLEPVSKYIPEERYRHEVVHHNNQLFMFGGGTGLITHSLEKIDMFDIDKLSWAAVQTMPCQIDRNASDFPTRRRCHSCTKFKDDVYLFGGMQAAEVLKDLWKFNLNSYQWTRLDAQIPIPVYFHGADVTPDGCLYVFGGVTVVDYERTNQIQKVWLQVPKLTLLCWDTLTNILDVNQMSKDRRRYVDLGIPSHFLDALL